VQLSAPDEVPHERGLWSGTFGCAKEISSRSDDATIKYPRASTEKMPFAIPKLSHGDRVSWLFPPNGLAESMPAAATCTGVSPRIDNGTSATKFEEELCSYARFAKESESLPPWIHTR
jgi:hypothetical protein